VDFTTDRRISKMISDIESIVDEKIEKITDTFINEKIFIGDRKLIRTVFLKKGVGENAIDHTL